jgi:hypothetical protein
MFAVLLALILTAKTLPAQTGTLAAIEAQREVLEYRNQTTDGRGNHGIREFLRASLSRSPEFAQAAQRYYTQLLAVDQRLGRRTSDGVAIQESANFDAWTLALEHSRQDPHRALLLMLIYGHDNMENLLARSSEETFFEELDRIRPLESSTLYRNAAIPALSYAASELEAGGRIARTCTQSYLRQEERRLCNDFWESYQADYYHVVAAAYLACRARIRSQGARFGPALRVHLLATRVYKLARFIERVQQVQARQNEPSPAIDLVNRYLLTHAVSGATLSLPGYSGMMVSRWFRGLTQRDYLAAQAILSRFDFELGFRERQHELGFRFGWQVCGGLQSVQIQ